MNDHRDSGSEAGDGLQGFLSNEEWDALLAHVDELIQEMEQLPDEDTRERVFELLRGIDAMHREALTRLVRLFKEGVLEQVITDPPIHTLMELYDLLPQQPDEDEEKPPAEDTAGKHRFPDIPIKVVPKTSGEGEHEAPLPHWVPVLASADALESSEVRVVAADDRAVLLCRVDDQLFALDPRCARDGGSLAQASLNRYALACPHHRGCYYDVRQGSRIGGGPGIECYAVRVDDNGRVLVGFGVPFEPRLPAF